mgnify:CR=1 FL=1
MRISLPSGLLALASTCILGGYVAIGCGRSGPIIEGGDPATKNCGDAICQSGEGEACDNCPGDCGYTASDDFPCCGSGSTGTSTGSTWCTSSRSRSSCGG